MLKVLNKLNDKGYKPFRCRLWSILRNGLYRPPTPLFNAFILESLILLLSVCQCSLTPLLNVFILESLILLSSVCQCRESIPIFNSIVYFVAGDVWLVRIT